MCCKTILERARASERRIRFLRRPLSKEDSRVHRRRRTRFFQLCHLSDGRSSFATHSGVKRASMVSCRSVRLLTHIPRRRRAHASARAPRDENDSFGPASRSKRFRQRERTRQARDVLAARPADQDRHCAGSLDSPALPHLLDARRAPLFPVSTKRGRGFGPLAETSRLSWSRRRTKGLHLSLGCAAWQGARPMRSITREPI
jgi:hypothetical protein